MKRLLRLLFAVALAFCSHPVAASADQRWLMTSDLHVDPFDRARTPSSYGRDTNWALFDAALAAMRRADPNPAVVVIAGDFLAHWFEQKAVAAVPRRSAEPAALLAMRRIATSFASAFPRAHFLVAFGNNDDLCGDYESTPNGRFLKEAERIWAPLVMRGGASPGFAQSFARGAYYTAVLPGGVRAVVVNSVYWSWRYRNACGSGDPGSQEFAWLERTLAGGKRTVMLMHIPPGIDAFSSATARRILVIPYLHEADEARLLRDVASPRSNVGLLLAGHLHISTFGILGNVPMLILPSISPIFGSNPSFIDARVAPGGMLEDYVAYDYVPAQRRWIAALDFDHSYGARAFDARDLLTLHARLARDPALRAMWASAYVSGSPHGDITDQNWRDFWCAQTFFDTRYAACAGSMTSNVLWLTGWVLLGCLAVLIVILSLRTWYASYR